MNTIEFLSAFAPDGPWDLVAFPIEGGGPTCQRFMPESAPQAAHWIQSKASGHNLYFHVNPNSAPSRKAKKGDVTEVRYLHVDLDPAPGADPDEERDRILASLTDERQASLPKPTFVLNSGNGYWGLWKLDEPIQLDGSEEAAEGAERFNRALEAKLGGDNCHNVDRVARLPGPDNRPNAKKRSLGRVVTQTGVVSHDPEATYPIALFNKAATKDEAVGKPTTRVKAAELGVVVFSGADTKPLLELGLQPRTVAIILHGYDPVEHPDGRPEGLDRSLVVFHVTCEMVRRGISDDTMAGVLTNRDWVITEHIYAQKGNALDYVARQIGRARDAVEIERATRATQHDEAMGDLSNLEAGGINPLDHDLLLAWGNHHHAVLSMGGKVVVMNLDAETPHMSYLYPSGFRDFLAHQHVYLPAPTQADPLKVKVVGFGSWWMGHPKRRTYQGTQFVTQDPDPRLYNLYRGFRVEPREGTCLLYMDHLRTNLCQGDDASFEYLIKWMARAVQHPEKPGGAAIVLKGERGTGKSSFAHWFGTLWEPTHYFETSDGKMITGDFNKHLDDKVVVFADEAFFAADRSQEGHLKTLITEERRSSHGKGLTPTMEQNRIHLIMASNADWVVPAGPHERRYLVLEVSNARRQDNAYFEAIRSEMENGGQSALLNLLQSIDLTGFDVFNAPKTAALRGQTEESLPPEEQWWLAKLESGQVYNIKSEESWPDEVRFDVLQDDYLDFMKSRNARHQLYPTQLGARLRKWGFPDRVTTRRNGQQVSVYKPFPDLETMRRTWDEVHGGQREWPVSDDGSFGGIF